MKKTKTILCFITLFLSSIVARAQERLDRDNLLLFRDGDGTVQPVKTMADWAKRRSEVVRAMESVMGKFPGKDRRVELDVQVEERADAGSYERLLIT